MDDRRFDQESARDWIELVESEAARSRETSLYPEMNAWLDRIAPIEILDIGSGQGVCSRHISREGRRYTGIEPSPYLLARSLKLYPQNETRRFLPGNAYALPLPDASFDAAFSIAVWHLLEDLSKAASELSRVLKPSGHFLIVTADPGNYPAWTGRYDESKQEGCRFEGRVRRPDGSMAEDVLFLHPYEDLMASLESHRLRVQRSERKGYFVSIYGIKQG